MTQISESGLSFSFLDGVDVIKFDDTKFYREYYNKLCNCKGVDIITDSDKVLQIIEVKNCVGHEIENMWRTSVNNSKRSSAPSGLDVDERDSLDIEVSKKVASTISCLFGAWTKSSQVDVAKELSTFWVNACSKKIPTTQKLIYIILFLEGNFDNPYSKTRNKKMIMKRLQDSISEKLSWLNCRVFVVDSATYKRTLFTVSGGLH